MEPPEPEEQQQPSRWSTFLQLVRLCGQCCYVVCPPVPEMITRKLAFHPPPKGFTYKMVVDDGTEVKSAKELLDKPSFRLQLAPGIRPVTPAEHREVMETVEPFVVTTARHNQLVGIKVSPSNSRCSYTPFDRMDLEQVVLFSQPNSSDLGHLLHPTARVFQRLADQLGVDVYGYDYSGYGYSTGSPSERNIYSDIQAIYDYIRQTRPDVRIVLVGFSIGTTASVHLAAQNPAHLAGVVLLAAFWSGLSLLRQRKDPNKEDTVDVFDRFRNIDRVASIQVPVLLIHGADDELVPIEHSQEMHKMLKKPVAPLYVYGANHSMILTYPMTFLRIRRFLVLETETLDVGPFLMAQDNANN